jgi:hypothetical protein
VRGKKLEGGDAPGKEGRGGKKERKKGGMNHA